MRLSPARLTDKAGKLLAQELLTEIAAVDDDVGERSPVLVVAVPADVDGTAEAQKVDNAGLRLVACDALALASSLASPERLSLANGYVPPPVQECHRR